MKKITTIKTRLDLANLLKIEVSKLTYILYIAKVNSYYQTFKIPKKDGSNRTIHCPTGNLKAIQKELSIVLANFKSNVMKKNKISHAFEKNKSIITNAQIHRNKQFIFNIDLESFFDSFHFGRVQGFFEKNKNFNLPREIAIMLAQICCYEGTLPQGAPTSPIITNLICTILDIRLLKIAKSFRLNYTRYADDLTFSTNDKNFKNNHNKFLEIITKEISRAGFKINIKKTRLQYNTSRQEVTGLVVNKKINISKPYYKYTRAMANTLYTTGSFTINGIEGSIDKLEGRLTFINQLDKYNNLLNNTKHTFFTLNSREKQYQKFLFYKYFFANTKPLLITEGKTDIVYIKSALKKLYIKYPNLICKNVDGNFEFRISFLKRTKRLRYFLNFVQDGADSMKNLYNFFDLKNNNPSYPNYSNYFSEISNNKSNYPIIFIFDNEMNVKTKPLYKFINHIKLDATKKQQLNDNYKIKLNDKLYLLTNQLIGNKVECEIEDLFKDETLKHKINGKMFNRNLDKLEGTNCYSKEIFSKYIAENYQKIDFSNFEPFLDNLNYIVSLDIPYKDIECSKTIVKT